MEDLQRIFESTLNQNLRSEVLSRVIKDKFHQLGITLNQKQSDYLRKRIASNKLDNFKLSIDDELIRKSNIPKETLSTKKLSINLADVDNLDKTIDEILQQFLSNLPELVSELTDYYIVALRKDYAQKLKPFQKQRHAFEAKLHKEWEEPLKLFEHFLFFAMELGEEFNNAYRPVAAQRNDHVFEALTRLHARSCQIGLEILTLLKSGFADGAHARWRTLHEIAVVSVFLSEYGEDIANRYLCYEIIDSYKAAMLYQRSCSRLGYEQLSSDEMHNFEKIYQQAKHQFGSRFTKDYGWAATIISKGRLTFSDIEKKVDMNHMRSYYKLASNNVHANPKSVFYRLGLSPTDKDILLAGPSNTGLADPANGTLLSISQITTTLLLHEANLDRIVASKALLHLNNDIQEAFTETQLNLEKTTKL